MKSKTFLSLTLAALLCIGVGTMAASTVWADTANLNPTDDSYVKTNQAGNNFGSEAVLIVRKHRTGAGANQNNRALLKFDLSGIPSGSTINAASLILYMEDAPGWKCQPKIDHL